ncbi:hypothetical protein [Alterisphingorhabdus coralli]|uniref:Uncharacterized protein n=1 Tax=Alterisphingorhabdus coralli TaxID=3071408 RepID=A0AA97I047_9SPHN|nr:hypothetical protein [Parasphingorhabdus sp. SCSIO 66989]WOE74043.1 hypothetical protein RB602_09230 [Parasphingorhabdus sp. SCSIO 66989]
MLEILSNQALTDAQKRELDLYESNRQPLEGPLNCSKGNKCSTDGTNWTTYKGEAIDGDYADWLANKQLEKAEELERKIQQMKERDGNT